MSKAVVVYEEEQAAQSIVKVLEAEGYTVLLATSGGDTVTLAEAHSPWLLVVAATSIAPDDIPQLRERLSNKNILIICLTSTISTAALGGADMYLTKPFNPQELMMFVRRLRSV